MKSEKPDIENKYGVISIQNENIDLRKSTFLSVMIWLFKSWLLRQ